LGELAELRDELILVAHGFLLSKKLR